jgi:hypothetical protein
MSKTKLVKCECGKIFSTKFCPDCGMKFEDVKKKEIPAFVTMYVHGDKETGYGYAEKFGIDPDSELGKEFIYANYEVKTIYKIVGNKLLLHQVDAGDGQGLLNVVKP